jgi:hypothetical protein
VAVWILMLSVYKMIPDYESSLYDLIRHLIKQLSFSLIRPWMRTRPSPGTRNYTLGYQDLRLSRSDIWVASHHAAISAISDRSKRESTFGTASAGMLCHDITRIRPINANQRPTAHSQDL